MSKRAVIIASAIIAGCLSISITSPSVSTARAEDECLKAPGGATPDGGHWYYRIERGTKRKCWYLADAGAKASKPKAAKASPGTEQDAAEPTAEDTPAPAPQKRVRKSVANARAELSAAVPDDDSALVESTWPPLNEPASNAASRDSSPAAITPPAPSVTAPSSEQSWTMASRWPEPNASTSSGKPIVQEPATQAPALTADRLVTAAATTGAAAAAPPATDAALAATALAPAAPATRTESETVSIGLLLSILVCVLALAAIVAPLIFNYVKPRRRKEVPAAGQPRSIWDSEVSQHPVPLFAHDDYQRQPVVLDDDNLSDRYFDEQPHAADNTADEIEQLLARASKRSAA